MSVCSIYKVHLTSNIAQRNGEMRREEQNEQCRMWALNTLSVTWLNVKSQISKDNGENPMKCVILWKLTQRDIIWHDWNKK